MTDPYELKEVGETLLDIAMTIVRENKAIRTDEEKHIIGPVFIGLCTMAGLDALETKLEELNKKD